MLGVPYEWLGFAFEYHLNWHSNASNPIPMDRSSIRMLWILFEWFELCLNGSKLYSNALNPVRMLGIWIRMLFLFPFIFHGCSTCNMCDQCTYQVVLWIHTFLCFLFSLAILGFPSLLPSSFPLPASLLLLPLPTAPTGSSMWCSWRWRNVCSTCGVEKEMLLLQLREV